MICIYEKLDFLQHSKIFFLLLAYEYLFPAIEMIIQTLDEEASIEKKDHTTEEQLSSFHHGCVADE